MVFWWGAGVPMVEDGHADLASLTPVMATTDAPCYELQPAPWAANAFSAHDADCQESKKVPWQATIHSDDEVEGFQSLHCTLDSTELKAIYSLDWCGSMVAAAGKEGWCSLFCVNDVRFQCSQGVLSHTVHSNGHAANVLVKDESKLPSSSSCKCFAHVQEPSETVSKSLISSRLHRSWLADVQLLPALTTSVDAEACRQLPWMLSACNDGMLTLWDPSRVDSSGRFAELASTMEAHTKGIFSMHVCPAVHGGSRAPAVETLTSSKDSTVALTSIDATGMQIIQRWEDLHCGTIKCVHWRDSKIAATAGNDR